MSDVEEGTSATPPEPVAAPLPAVEPTDPPDRRALTWTRVAVVFFFILTMLFASLFGWAFSRQDDDDNNNGSVEQEATMNVQELRKALNQFVDSIALPLQNRTYYRDATLQEKQWLICTIVEQCLIPKYGVAVSLLTTDQKEALFRALEEVMTLESYQMLLQQEQANLVLGQYQLYASTCNGTCVQYPGRTAYGLWNERTILVQKGEEGSNNLEFEECAQANQDGTTAADTNATWLCSDFELALYGDVNTSDPDSQTAYLINNLFEENRVHPRGDSASYMSVYGDLTGGGQFGFRYTGHHIDLNVVIIPNGTINTLPAFLGHNPIAVLPSPMSLNENNEVGNDPWTNLRGVTLFPSSAELFAETFSKALLPGAFIPLSAFDSTPANGGLTLKNGLELMNNADVPNAQVLGEMDSDSFRILWELLSYIRGLTKPHADGSRLEQHFRETGRLIWTSFNSTEIPTTAAEVVSRFGNFYIRVETPDYLTFVMVNQMFTFVHRDRPSNHMHGLFIPKSYLLNVIPADESQGDPWPTR